MYLSTPLYDFGRAACCAARRFSFGSCVRCLSNGRTSASANLRTATLPWTQLHVDTRLLGMGLGWILLGSRHMAYGSRGRAVVDPRLLGLVQWRLLI